MTGELSAEYKSNSQRARVVTESWGEQNLYCPNCSSSKLNRLAHNTQASDFSCPDCHFWFQLKGQQAAIGRSITDGAYAAMIRAIETDKAPSYYFMHYDAATWTVRNLLLVPHFVLPPSAIMKRGAGVNGAACKIMLDRIPADARIPIITTIKASHAGDTECIMISRPEEVREKFHRFRAFADIPAARRALTLDVLNMVRRLTNEKLKIKNAKWEKDQGLVNSSPMQFSNGEIYAYERELGKWHPGNRHIRDKIRQQLQVLRDLGFLSQTERGVWRVVN